MKIGDAISRQAVLDLVADYDLSMGQVVKAIHALPSVTPQPRTGRWIDQQDNGRKVMAFWERYECSECGCHHNNDAKFCPNCGAKMEVEE